VKCRLCERETDLGLCQFHAEAEKQIESAYRAWKEAYGVLAWTEYLARVIKNPETGQWAIEVARLMLRSSGNNQAVDASS